jgi:hypothetical protein
MKHRHNFVTIDSHPIDLTYIKKPLFGKPYEFSKQCLARLKRCECGAEQAEVVEQPEKWYIDRRDIPEGVGEVSPEWYKAKFAGEIQETQETNPI